MHQANDLMPPLNKRSPRSLVTMTVNATLVLEGDLDCSTEREVTRRIARLVESADVIRIDARKVSFIDAAGVRTLLLAKREALKNGTSVTLEISRRGAVERLCEITGLSDLIA
jgi:anti-anti-sigma factor